MVFNIDESDIGIEYQDAGPWRSYGLESSGETIEELFENATIYETDQDGGEIDSYSIDDAEVEVYRVANKFLSDLVSGDVSEKEEQITQNS